jgi:hypothetical protein
LWTVNGLWLVSPLLTASWVYFKISAALLASDASTSRGRVGKKAK